MEKYKCHFCGKMKSDCEEDMVLLKEGGINDKPYLGWVKKCKDCQLLENI